MAGLVIDASVASAWCFPDERTGYSNAVLQAMSGSLLVVAPRLWAYEVRNSVLLGLRRGRIIKSDAEDFLGSLADLNIQLVDSASYDSVFHLAERTGLTVYDATYLDLASSEGSKLASLDSDLRKAATKSGVELFDTPGS